MGITGLDEAAYRAKGGGIGPKGAARDTRPAGKQRVAEKGIEKDTSCHVLPFSNVFPANISL